MTTSGQRVKQKREELNMTQDDLAKKVGYKSRTSINKIELDLQQISPKKIRSMAAALNTSPDFLMGWDDNLIQLEFKANKPTRNDMVRVLGRIACGEPSSAEQIPEIVTIDDIQPIKADFCLRAKGNSMINARIQDGDIVFIRKQEMVENGEIAAVLINNEATLKRVYYYPDDGKLVLQAENPAYEPFVYVGEELNNIRIIGKAIAFQSCLES